MGQGVRTGLGHGGITCVLQTQFSSSLLKLYPKSGSILKDGSRFFGLFWKGQSPKKYGSGLYINVSSFHFRCEEAVKAYLADSDVDAVINVGADMRKIHHCYRIMKVKVFIIRD